MKTATNNVQQPIILQMMHFGNMTKTTVLGFFVLTVFISDSKVCVIITFVGLYLLGHSEIFKFTEKSSFTAQSCISCFEWVLAICFLFLQISAAKLFLNSYDPSRRRGRGFRLGRGSQVTHFLNGVCKEDNRTSASFQVAIISSYPCLS